MSTLDNTTNTHDSTAPSQEAIATNDVSNVVHINQNSQTDGPQVDASENPGEDLTASADENEKVGDDDKIGADEIAGEDDIDLDEKARVTPDAKLFSGQLRRYAIKLVESKKAEEERQQGQDHKGHGGGFGLGVPGFLAHRKANSIRSAEAAANLIEKMDRMNEMMVSATTDSEKSKIRHAISKQGEALMKHMDDAMTPEAMTAAGQRGMKMEDILAIREGAKKWVSTFDESPDMQSMKEKMEAFFKRIGEMIEKLFKSTPTQDRPNERPE